MDNSTYRERAGVRVSGAVVYSLIATGPVQMVAQLYTGQQITFDQTWMATVAGLAGTAFGYLIGKQSTNAPGSATVNVPVQVTATEPPKS